MVNYIVGWFIGALFVGLVFGKPRSIGFLASFLISLLTSPVLGLIITLFSETNERIEERKRLLLAIQNQRPQNNVILSDEMNKIKGLYDSGTFTSEEFEAAKKKLLSLMNNNVETVNRIYDAFGKGDIPTIINYIADNVQWEEWEDNSAQKAGVPWMQAQKGKQGVIDFFNIAGELEVKDFQVLSIMANDRQVTAEFVFEARVPSTGNRYRDEEIHLWTFNEEGKVIGLRHYADTAKLIAAVKESN